VEHSLLHVAQLLGLVVATAGPLLWLVVARGLATPSTVDAWQIRSLKISRAAACLGATAVAFDVFVQVAEANGQTVFGGVALADVRSFLFETTVGGLAIVRIVLLSLAALTFSLPRPVAWQVGLVFCLAAVAATALVSHAAAQPQGRLLALGLQVVHLLAVSAWMGVLFHWWLTRQWLLSTVSAEVATFRARLLQRFSPWALVVVSVLFASGIVSALRFVPAPRDLFYSAYGLTLSLKLVFLLPVVWAGFVNFRSVVPALAASPLAAAHGVHRFRQTLELEVTAGLLVIAVAGVVGSVSPPGNDGSVTLTREQVAVATSPRLPKREFVDPSSFVGAPERNKFDLEYSEFMHNWSGVFVIAMGLAWWLQSVGGHVGRWATRVWPAVLIPFAAFIAYFADPEVFVLRQVSFREAISDPVVLEHQIGAVLVLVLVWLGRKDKFRPPRHRPLGPALPLLMMIGGLLLLGHAHSSVRSTQELTNLINVQHAVFGSLGMLAGFLRWLMLRELIPEGFGKHAWPALIVALGASMAFFYRETGPFPGGS